MHTPKAEDKVRAILAVRELAEELGDERKRQIYDHGYDADQDDGYTDQELALAAAAYLVDGTHYEDTKGVFTDCPSGSQHFLVPGCWPRGWHPAHFRPTTRRRTLIKAGALILAEIARLDRARAKANGSDKGGGQ